MKGGVFEPFASNFTSHIGCEWLREATEIFPVLYLHILCSGGRLFPPVLPSFQHKTTMSHPDCN